MRKLWILLVVVVVAALAIVLAGIRGRRAPTELTIGALLPLTGDGAKYGEAARQGIELALDEVNAAGGLNGIALRVVYEDSQGDPKGGVAAIHKLIAVQNVPAVIGDLFSSVTLAVAPIVNQRKVVLLSPASSAPTITDAGAYVFRNCASDIFEGSIMGRFTHDDLNLTTVAILYINNDYGVGIRDVFKKTFTAAGGRIVEEDAFDQSATDFRTQLTKIKASGAQAVYIVGYKELGPILKQAAEIGLHSQFLSTVMFEDPDILKVAGQSAEGVIYSARAYDPESGDRPTREFVTKFRHKYDATPDIFSALSYDAMKILVLAMQKGGATAEGIKGALYTISHYPGVVGDTSFDENGDVVQPALIKTVRDGSFVPYE